MKYLFRLTKLIYLHLRLVFCMKGFAIPLLGVIFVILITSSVPSIAVDDPVDNKEVSEDADKLNIVPTEDPKYKIYLHVIVRNAQSELISVTETLPCQFGSNCFEYMPKCYLCREAHEVTDYAFDTLLGKKEIIAIDNIKYEKVQFSDSSEQTVTTITYYNQYLFDRYDREPTGRWVVEICGEVLKKFGFECAQIFQSRTSVVWLEVGDVTTTYWTILRETN